MIMTVFMAGTLLLLFSGVPGLVWRGCANGGERTALVLLLAGALLGTGGTVAALKHPAEASLSLPWAVPGGVFTLAIDPISACFLFPVFLIGALGAIYALGYWPHRTNPETGRRLRLFYGLIAGSLTLVLTASNGLLFLAAWEIMALAGFFLITTEEKHLETRRAGFIYLTCAHTGTLALFALFILLEQGLGSFAFPAPSSLDASSGLASAIFLLALFGFGVKAGLTPLHIWLPGAHAAAPSHVSAFLSGVMIKSGIYGLVRVSGFFAAPPVWWGSTILILGVVSGVLGVVFAIAQHDIKRLLAYHSVENIGIIAMGLGAALLGKSYDLPLLTILGLAGALLHVINHGLFKSLLFLGAGAMIHATGTREIEHYGGLLRRLPLTGIAFLGGAVAICGLPPLNGFVSEWLIYLGLFQSLGGETLGPHLSLFAIPALALIGGLALACFVKVFGIAFLGAPRTPAAAQAHEAPACMLWPMGILLACCLTIGLWPGALLPLLAQAASLWSDAAVPITLLTAHAPATALSWCALGLLLLLAAAAGALRLGLRKAPPRTATWGCGYPLPTARMQYTASSFGALLVDLFRWGLRPDQHGGKARGLLPTATEFSCHTPDTILDRGVIPVCRGAIRVFSRLRALIQNGSTSFYLLYVALALFGLLTLATLSRG